MNWDRKPNFVEYESLDQNVCGGQMGPVVLPNNWPAKGIPNIQWPLPHNSSNTGLFLLQEIYLYNEFLIVSTLTLTR